MIVPTPHNNAKKGDIATTVLMPGDPLRAKYIADKYLDNVICYNEIRNMLGYTGKYKGKTISIQGSGMGVPSMGIYSRELYEGYDVKNIIRIGTAGSLANEESSKIASSVSLKDILVATDVLSNSNYLIANGLENNVLPECSKELLYKLRDVSSKLNIKLKEGKIYTSDIFYSTKQQLVDISKLDVLGVEMETLALYTNANMLGKNAIAIFTVSDNPISNLSISANERQSGLNNMIELALELAINCDE